LKLTRISWILIAIGTFVIIVGSLGFILVRQTQRQTQLDSEAVQSNLELIKSQLPQLSDEKAELETELSQAKSVMDTSRSVLSQPIEAVGIISTFVDAAKANAVQVTEVSSSELATERLEGVPCSIRSLSAQVTGQIPNLVSFVCELNNQFDAGVVKSLTMSLTGPTGNETGLASVTVVVYSYGGE
jgi:hypothetical protein